MKTRACCIGIFIIALLSFKNETFSLVFAKKLNDFNFIVTIIQCGHKIRFVHNCVTNILYLLAKQRNKSNQSLGIIEIRLCSSISDQCGQKKVDSKIYSHREPERKKKNDWKYKKPNVIWTTHFFSYYKVFRPHVSNTQYDYNINKCIR